MSFFAFFFFLYILYIVGQPPPLPVCELEDKEGAPMLREDLLPLVCWLSHIVVAFSIQIVMSGDDMNGRSAI